MRVVLAAEADDVPAAPIDAHPWFADDLALDAIVVDQEMVARHDADPIH